jgi:hypothetical protein
LLRTLKSFKTESAKRPEWAIQCLGQFLAGIVIAFVKGWKLALVLLASMPLLGLVGSMMVWSLTKLVGSEQVRSSTAYLFVHVVH